MAASSTHCSLKDEWTPSGALEEDAVYTILTCIWRKRRIRDKRNLDILAALQRQDLKALSEKPTPLFDTRPKNTIYALSKRPSSGERPKYADKVSHSLALVVPYMECWKFLELMIGMLGGEPSAHLLREVPKANYSTTPEGVRAINHEVDEVLLPRARAEMESPHFLAGRLQSFMTPDRILEDLGLG